MENGKNLIFFLKEITWLGNKRKSGCGGARVVSHSPLRVLCAVSAAYSPCVTHTAASTRTGRKAISVRELAAKLNFDRNCGH